MKRFTQHTLMRKIYQARYNVWWNEYYKKTGDWSKGPAATVDYRNKERQQDRDWDFYWQNLHDKNKK